MCNGARHNCVQSAAPLPERGDVRGRMLQRLDTDTPVLILHSSREGVAAATLVGTYEDSIGTCVLFTEKLEEPGAALSWPCLPCSCWISLLPPCATKSDPLCSGGSRIRSPRREPIGRRGAPFTMWEAHALTAENTHRLRPLQVPLVNLHP
jgi:hypothetical protein